MPLTGSAKPAKAAPSGHKLIQSILDQLDSEWATLKHDDPALHGDEAGLLAYYHTCLRSLLPLVGDPYTATFPQGYIEAERLPKLCAYLTGLKDADPALVKQARERTLAGLRDCWPAYARLTLPDGVWPATYTQPDDVLPFSWAAIESGWNGEDDDPHRTQMLPTFATQASADFHLASLAVLYLNRQLRLYLTDLQPHPTDIAGRHA